MALFAQIKEYLDKHVVGQDMAKKRLAVAVYYHYKKVQHNMKNARSLDKTDSQREYTSKGLYHIFMSLDQMIGQAYCFWSGVRLSVTKL